MTDQDLSPQQQAMVGIWEKHMAAEFKTKNIDTTMATMTWDPYVNHVPVMTGGWGIMKSATFTTPILFPAAAGHRLCAGQPDGRKKPHRRRTNSQVYTDDRDAVDSPRCTAHG